RKPGGDATRQADVSPVARVRPFGVGTDERWHFCEWRHWQAVSDGVGHGFGSFIFRGRRRDEPRRLNVREPLKPKKSRTTTNAATLVPLPSPTRRPWGKKSEQRCSSAR